MEVKSKFKKLGLLSQAVLASTVCLMPISASAVDTVINGGDAPIPNGTSVLFKTDNIGTLADGSSLIDSSSVPGVSAYTTVTNQGTLKFAGAGNAPTDIGQSTALLKLLQLNGDGKANVLSGQIFATDVDIDAAGGAVTLTLKNNTTVTNDINVKSNFAHVINVDNTNGSLSLTTGTGVTTANNGVGTLNFVGDNTTTVTGELGTKGGKALAAVNTTNGGTVIVSNHITATNTNLKNTSTLNMNADGKTITGALTAANTATLNLNNNTLTVTGATDFPANTRIALQASDADFGVLDASAAGLATAAGNDTKLTVTPIGYLSNAAALQIAKSNAAINTIAAANITGHSAVLGLTTAAAGKNLNLVIARNAYNSGVHGLNDQAAGLGGALEADGAAGRLAASNPDFEAFVGNVDRLATSAEVATALSTAAPTVNSAIVGTAHEIGERVLTNIDNRITLVRSGQGSYNTGMSAGDTTEGWGVWGELFGSDFTQDKRNNIEGYDGNLWGVTLGVDWMVDNATLLGLAATYSTTSVDHDLASNTLDIDSFQGSLYGSFTCNPWYVQGMLGVAHHDYDQTRNVIVGTTTMGRALGDYKAWEWLANAEAGYIWTDGEWNFIPSVSLRYSHLSIDDYTETGGSGFNLRVRNEDVNAFVAGLGFKVQYNNVYGGSRIVPEAHVGAFYDFIADRQETSSNIFGTGTAFSAKGFDPAHDSYEVGVGLNIYTERNSIFSLSYDYHFKSDFHSHNGFVKLRYQW